MLRYSNKSLLGVATTNPQGYIVGTESHLGDKTTFTSVMYTTMNSILAETASNQSGKKYTTKMVSVTNSIPLYALQQCTPDLRPGDCSSCLRIAIDQLSLYSSSRTLLPSCNVRYESFPFYIGAPTFLPLTPAAAKSPNSGKNKVSATVIVAILLPVVVVATIIVALAICFVKKRSKNYNAVPVGSGEDFATLDSLQYDLETLQLATNSFSEENKIAEGGFGGVYKGILSNGQEIAVKRLSKSSGQGAQEFKNEVLFIAKLQHRNLVRLLGFCLAEGEKLLVYEYVPNKSLDHFIFDPKKQGQLDWVKRYKIIGGIARGMLYLHEDSRLRIIHRDLKASNVLLDADMNPKVSDFGMAKIFGVDQIQGNTSRVVGTYGYMSPEYAMHGKFSVKSDVYSFGVLVLEIISSKRNSSFYQSGYAKDLLSYAWKQWKDGKHMEFVDPTIRESCSSSEVLRCMHLGLLCVQEALDERPTMARAMLMLDTHSTIFPPVPKEPAFFSRSVTESSSSEKGISSDQSTSKSVPWSVNDISVSEVEAR